MTSEEETQLRKDIAMIAAIVQDIATGSNRYVPSMWHELDSIVERNKS